MADAQAEIGMVGLFRVVEDRDCDAVLAHAIPLGQAGSYATC